MGVLDSSTAVTVTGESTLQSGGECPSLSLAGARVRLSLASSVCLCALDMRSWAQLIWQWASW